jgi:hypothetical protein
LQRLFENAVMKKNLSKNQKEHLKYFLNLTDSARFAIGDALSEFGQKLLEQSIRESNPEITKTELALEVFRRRYGSEFSPEELEKILASIRAYHDKKDKE